MRTIVSVAAAAAALALAVGVPAAADSGSAVITGLTKNAAGAVTLTFAAPALPPGAGLDPATVEVTVGHRRVPATATGTRIHTVGGTPVDAMLVVDTSGSMNGAGLASARQALDAFVAAVPADVRVGLMTFAWTPRLALAPTTARPPLRSTFASLRAGGETALYDAILAAAKRLPTSDERRLVVLSDGADTVSHVTLGKVVTTLRAAQLPVEVVALHTAAADTRVLQTLASRTGGKFVRAEDGGQLAQALQSSARSYATQLLVHAQLPRGLTGTQLMGVSADSSAGRVTATTKLFLATPSAAPRAGIPAPTPSPRFLLIVGLAAIAISLLLGFLAIGGGDTIGRRRMRRLVGKYTTAAPQPVHYSEASPVARTALDLADRIARTHALQERLTLRLERAAISLTPSEWVLLQAGVAVGTVLLFTLLGMHPLLAVLLGIVAGPAMGHASLGVRASRRRSAFVAMLPDTLQLLAGSLSAGYSLAQAMDGIVREGSQPVAAEIGRALAESRLGVPVERTLDSVATRMQSEDFRWVVLAIQIQRQVGGNLAEVLMTVAHTMRERVALRRHVRALSAEGRLSAYILIALPIFLTLYMFMVRRDYIRPLYTTKFGFVMLGFGSVLMVIGSIVMKKMATVEV